MSFSLDRREVIGIAAVLALYCGLSWAMQPDLGELVLPSIAVRAMDRLAGHASAGNAPHSFGEHFGASGQRR